MWHQVVPDQARLRRCSPLCLDRERVLSGTEHKRPGTDGWIEQRHLRFCEPALQREILPQRLVGRPYQVTNEFRRGVVDAAIHTLASVVLLEEALVEVNDQIALEPARGNLSSEWADLGIVKQRCEVV